MSEGINSNHDLEEWGHPTNVTQQQRKIWELIREKWNAYAQHIPEPSLDVGAGTKKGRTVSIDPFPRGEIDVRGVAEHLPLRDGYFKSVVLESVIKHVNDPLLVLQESLRVSQSESYLFLTSPVNIVDKHRHSFTSKELNEIITSAGYQIVRSKGFGFSNRRLDRLVRKFGLGLYVALPIPSRFCRNLMIVAKADRTQ